MALITPSGSGSPITYQAAVGPDTFVNAGNQRLHVRNGGGSPINVTLTRVGACNQGVVHTDAAIAVSNGSDKLFAALNPAIYGTTVTVTYSGVTSVTVGVITV